MKVFNIRKRIINDILEDKCIKVGPFDVIFTQFGTNNDWISSQLSSLEKAQRILTEVDDYYQKVIEKISKILFIDIKYKFGMNRYYHLAMIHYVPDLTDDPVYLASLLVKYTYQMSSNIFIPLKIRQNRGVKAQLEFLSSFPEGKYFYDYLKGKEK